MRWEDLPAKSREIIENELKKASEALQNIESILKEEVGLNLPKDNVKVPENLRIKLPKGYIRTVEAIEREYQLHHIPDNNLRKNIAYAIQYTDFLNYILNRFSLGIDGLTVGIEFRKHAVIHVITIIEAFLAGIIEKFAAGCLKCSEIDTCMSKIAACIRSNAKHFKNLQKANKTLLFSKCIRFLKEVGYESSDYITKLEELKEYRDRVHIQYKDKNSGQYIRDFDEKYHLELYNRAIIALKRVREVVRHLDEMFVISCRLHNLQ